jgi:tRNA-dihydrouridine synthase 4
MNVFIPVTTVIQKEKKNKNPLKHKPSPPPTQKRLTPLFSFSPPLSETIHWLTLVQRTAALSYITIHGRLRTQRSSTPPNYAAIRLLRPYIKIPLVANGDAYTAADVVRIARDTGADGVMAARGLLENPALFSPFPADEGRGKVGGVMVREFLQWAMKCPIPFALVLHHAVEMMAAAGGMTTKRERRAMMQCADLLDLWDFVEGKWPPLP